MNITRCFTRQGPYRYKIRNPNFEDDGTTTFFWFVQLFSFTAAVLPPCLSPLSTKNLNACARVCPCLCACMIFCACGVSMAPFPGDHTSSRPWSWSLLRLCTWPCSSTMRTPKSTRDGVYVCVCAFPSPSPLFPPPLFLLTCFDTPSLLFFFLLSSFLLFFFLLSSFFFLLSSFFFLLSSFFFAAAALHYAVVWLRHAACFWCRQRCNSTTGPLCALTLVILEPCLRLHSIHSRATAVSNTHSCSLLHHCLSARSGVASGAWRVPTV